MSEHIRLARKQAREINKLEAQLDAKEAEVKVLTSCRDHWKLSYKAAQSQNAVLKNAIEDAIDHIENGTTWTLDKLKEAIQSPDTAADLVVITKEEHERLKKYEPKPCSCWRCMGLEKDPYADDEFEAEGGGGNQ